MMSNLFSTIGGGVVVSLITVAAAAGGQWYLHTLHTTLEERLYTVQQYEAQQALLSATVADAEQAVRDTTELQSAALKTGDVVTFISELETAIRALGVMVETQSIEVEDDSTPSVITFDLTLTGSWPEIRRVLQNQLLSGYAFRSDVVEISATSAEVSYRLQFSVLQFNYDF